jgi:serine/threonine-protein kinase
VRQRTPRPEAAPAHHNTQSLAEDTQAGSMGKKIALVAVPLLLIAAGGAFVMLRPSTPAPTAPPAVATAKKEPAPEPKAAAPAVDSMIRVQLRSTPSGATVFDGDVQIGTTPTDRQLRRDQLHELTFRLADHQTVKRKLDLHGVLSDSEEVSVTLEPVKAAATSEPSRPSRPAKQGKDKDDNKDDSVPIFE